MLTESEKKLEQVDKGTRDWWRLCDLSSKHEHFALVKLESGYIGGCCEGIVSFLVFGAKTGYHLQKKFEKIMKLAIGSSLQVSPDYSGEDDDTAKKAIEQGTIKEVFEDVGEMIIGMEKFSLLHYGECSDMINIILFASNSNTVPKLKEKRISIPDELGIWEYDSYEDIPAAKKAWITIKAKQRGLNPVMVHAGIKARFARGK